MDPEQKNSNSSSFLQELLHLVLISLIIVIPFRIFIAQPFIVDGASMDPTFHTGDYLIVDELSYRFKTPERGSVLIFKYPKDTKKSFIKRVIGLPGETITIDHGSVSVNGKTLTEPYVKLTKDDSGVYTMGQDEYFVLGDNRFGSADSRLWGAVPEKNIIGRPILRFHPFSIMPGNVNE